MYLSSNIKFLRTRRRWTQNDLADRLSTNRSAINNYENDTAFPPIGMLLALSDLFAIAMDTLVRIDLSALSESQLYALEHGSDVFVKGSNLRVLATTVDRRNRDNIELVSHKAKAGYLNGFADTEFIADLPVFQLPFLSSQKKYRAFQISGDSMPPFADKAWITGEFVQDWVTLRDDQLCIVLTINEGIVFKKIRNELNEKGSLRMISLNTAYEPYNLPVMEIREVWKFVLYMTPQMPEYTSNEELLSNMKEIRQDIMGIKRILYPTGS